jgi:monoterpene epsilon-lactone hydrolase
MASPELQKIVKLLTSQPMPSGGREPSLEELRTGFERLAALFPPEPDVRSETVDAKGVSADWIEAPGADASRALLYLHGGGYAIGSVNTHRDLASRIARAARVRALSVEYRLAPEHPHPAAVEDSTIAYRWLLRQGLEPSRIAIAGDSAGGGLAIATLVALRDAGDPLPAAGVCLSPWVDLQGIGESMTTKAELDPLVQRDGLVKMGRLYLGDLDPRTPLAAPLYADLAGLPPLLIQVGTAEALLDDATRVAGRARAAGVDVTLEPWDDMIHVWQIFAALLPEAREAIDRIGEFVRKQIA